MWVDSRKLSDKIGLGIALRYINSNLAAGQEVDGTTYKTGHAVAGDLSFFYTGVNESGQGWNFGATLSNLGTKIGYTNDAKQKDYIPANIGIGTSYTAAIDEANKITFGLDINKLLVPTPPIATGDFEQDSAILAEIPRQERCEQLVQFLRRCTGWFQRRAERVPVLCRR